MRHASMGGMNSFSGWLAPHGQGLRLAWLLVLVLLAACNNGDGGANGY